MSTINKNISFKSCEGSPLEIETMHQSLSQWIKREQSLLFLSKKASYSIEFEKIDSEYLKCFLNIQIGQRQWNGYGKSDSLENAFKIAKKNLKISFKENLNMTDIYS